MSDGTIRNIEKTCSVSAAKGAKCKSIPKNKPVGIVAFAVNNPLQSIFQTATDCDCETTVEKQLKEFHPYKLILKEERRDP